MHQFLGACSYCTRVQRGQDGPEGFERVDFDESTGKQVGWVPVGDGPEDRWHREAVGAGSERGSFLSEMADGTYELVGPKVRGNPEGAERHVLVRHGAEELPDVPRTYEGLQSWVLDHRHEGVVWHHPDGRAAKVKRRGFGG